MLSDCLLCEGPPQMTGKPSEGSKRLTPAGFSFLHPTCFARTWHGDYPALSKDHTVLTPGLGSQVRVVPFLFPLYVNVRDPCNV